MIPEYVPEAWEIEDMDRARKVREYVERELAEIPIREYVQDNRKVPNVGEER
jgi:hypothetical protein